MPSEINHDREMAFLGEATATHEDELLGLEQTACSGGESPLLIALREIEEFAKWYREKRKAEGRPFTGYYVEFK